MNKLIVIGIVASCVGLLSAVGISANVMMSSELLTKIDSHTVEIISLSDSGMGRCSGVVLENNSDNALILTAKHCIGPSEEMYVENNLVIDIGVAVTDDLAYLRVQGNLENKVPVTMAAENLKRKDKVYIIGYPHGAPYIEDGHIEQTTKDWQIAEVTVIGGCSGGGFFNENGELIGIVWGGYESEPTSLLEPISDVKKFLKEKGLI